MESLPIFLGLRGRPVVLVGDGPIAEAKRRLLTRAGARIVGTVEDGARIAIVALEGMAAEAAAAGLKAQGLLVNVVDRPDLCDFTLPAIVDRAPVTIAIGTGGRSASLAKAIRQRLEAMLAPTLGSVAEALRAARPAVHARFPDAARRRLAFDAALAPGGPLDPFAGPGPDAVGAWLSSAGTPRPDRLDRIALRSADPDDLTIAQARIIAGADTLYHAADVPAVILDRARADASRIPCSTLPAALPPGRSVHLTMAQQ